MKTIAMLFITLTVMPAFASKARVGALLGANHIKDAQTVFTAPSHVLALDPLLTFEMGAAGTDAEGGVLQKLDSGAMLYVYLGHQNTSANFFNGDVRTGNGFLGQNNPVEVIYGKGNMAYGVSLSNVDNKLSETKETTAVLKFGMNNGEDNWFYGHFHLASTAEKPGTGGADTASVSYITVGGSYEMSPDNRVYGELDIGKSEIDPANATAVDIDDTNITIGYESRRWKGDKADIYYGLELNMVTRKFGDADVNAQTLPAFIGIEHQANDWATVRASVSQNILIGNTKDEVTNGAGADSDGIANNTTVAAGLGLKYGNFVLDGLLTAATTGNVNGSTFLSTASLTYNF